MATIAFSSGAPGRGGSGPIFGMGSRPLKVVTGTFSFDSSYPTGGEDLTELFDLFNDVSGVSRLQGVIFDQPLTGTQTGKFIEVDYSTKKALLYTNASPAVEVTGSSDQSAITNLRFIAWGPRF